MTCVMSKYCNVLSINALFPMLDDVKIRNLARTQN